MAGSRNIFDEAMRQGTNYAWDKQWNKAVAEYQRAIAEFPDEVSAYTALGHALVYSGRTGEALVVYQQAARLTPDDPLALARVAEIQERLDDIDGSVKTWLLAADMHLRRTDVDAAVQVWQHVVELVPSSVAARERLAKAYAGMDQTRKAIRQYLALAANYQQHEEDANATAVCKRALELDPRNPDVLTAMEALEQGRPVSAAIKEKAAPLPYSSQDVGVDRENSLVETARQNALTELAGALLEDTSFAGTESIAALLQGIDFQSRGEVGQAIESYEKAMAVGTQSAAARFNLGLLYQENLRFDEATVQLRQVEEDPDYGLAARFALGECLRALGRLDEAVVPFVEVLRLVDLSTVGPERVDSLTDAYESLLHRYGSSASRASVASFINALAKLLGGGQWDRRAREMREQLDRLDGDRVISLAEILTQPNYERILNSMVTAHGCFEAGKLRSASEEFLWAIDRAPGYLPLHLSLARLFMQSNHVGAAIDKYLFVADTFAARDELENATGLYEQVLRLAPMNLDVRHKLIALLREHRMVEQALEHQLALAEAFFELAQVEASQEQYREALHLASQLPDNTEWTARILRRLGDIDYQRLDWHSAIQVFLELKAAVPDDDGARRRLVDLHFNLARRREAIAELDELIDLYRRQGNLEKGLQVLDELLGVRPEELELHKKAAQLCVQLGNKEGAISYLDAMGELQLKMGRVQDASATIKAIIALRPKDVDAYRELLDQIA